jgi:threonylcarbamoyladenosine tRNA methylthiotransferase CDKAL1
VKVMRYFVESYGCAMNRGEGEQLARRMDALGHERVFSDADADIIILNTCTVVDATEKKMIRRMGEIGKTEKDVVVSGCMAKVQANRIEVRLPHAMILPPDQYDLFPGKAESAFGGGAPLQRDYGMQEILPIAQGCLGKCTYCITRLARGRLVSRPEDEILSEFKDMIDAGTKEIFLTAQDTACYGKDIGSGLPRLLRRMLEFDGDYRIRIGMTNPDALDPVLDEILDCMEDRRVYRFLHIPLQSGSNRILRKMERRYTVARFMGIVNRARERFPDISISTDMITGFPGESEADHEKSAVLIRRLRADTVNITRFSSRPGTEAASMDGQVAGGISKDRSADLTRIKMTVEAEGNTLMVGKTLRALVSEQGKQGTVIARTDNYRPVGVPGDIPLGTFIDVEIIGSAPTHLLGRQINTSNQC